MHASIDLRRCLVLPKGLSEQNRSSKEEGCLLGPSFQELEDKRQSLNPVQHGVCRAPPRLRRHAHLPRRLQRAADFHFNGAVDGNTCLHADR